VKRKNNGSREKLHLAKETIRRMLSEDDLQQVAGGGCPSRTGCSTSEAGTEAGTLYCSMIQY
jgi:hypothetical protein